MGPIFTSKGGVMQLEGQSWHAQAAPLLSKRQDANHQFCIRNFLEDHNQGEGKGVRCRDVPIPKTQLCQGCLNKKAEDKYFRNHVDVNTLRVV